MADLSHRLEIPGSSSTVQVYIIDNGARLSGLSGASMMDPVLPGYEEGGEVPSYVFLIYHEPTNTRLLFDLSIHSDWRAIFAPAYVKAIDEIGLKDRAGKDIADILTANSVGLSDINAVIFSHHHFDHTGDISKFPPSVSLLVGPGYKEAFLPGWPANRKQVATSSDTYEGRETRELNFSSDDSKVLSIGDFAAYDYFGDGSFYILSTPGHTIGHLSALARTVSQDGKSTFIFMGGDIVHCNAVFRPSLDHPLPETIPVPSDRPFASNRCPTEHFARMHRLYSEPEGVKQARMTPFSRVAGPEHDLVESQRSADKLAIFDADENVLVVHAHDASLQEVLDFFPNTANNWKEKGWKNEGHWRWLAPCMSSIDKWKL